jgi:hypothetical protein
MENKNTLEDIAEDFYSEQSKAFENDGGDSMFDTSRYLVAGFIDGAKWQAERMYSEEEVLGILYKHTEDFLSWDKITLEEWFKQFKKQENGK